MIRNIYVGENYSRKVVTPLITTDQNSYKIIWDTKCKNGVFKITAIKADNLAVFDFGELSDEGVATYVVANNMYDTEGPLKLLLAIVEEDSITTCREINFTVKEGADEASFAENNANPINNLAMQISATSNENNQKIQNLKNYGVTNVYILKEGEDIIVSENIVTEFLKHNYSQYEAIAFPEGVTEINLPDTNGGGDTPLTANKVIMPKSLKSIGRFSFANYAQWDDDGNLIDTSIVVDVKEYVLNEGLEIIDNNAFADNIYLEKVNIPKSLKNIGRGAFQHCDSLKEVFIPATVTEIEDGNFNCSTYKQEDSTIIYGYAGSVAEYYAKNENILKDYTNTFINVGCDYSIELNNKADKDELNLKLYGTTDVYTLTEDDVWIEGTQITGQKINGKISHDIIVIPEGITQIVNEPQTDEEGYPNGTSFALNLKADKIILPNTLTGIFMDGGYAEFQYIFDGELVLNDNITYISTADRNGFNHLIKKMVINSSLKELRHYEGSNMEIIIPKDINNKLKIYFGHSFAADVYVYNPLFDFSNVTSDDGTEAMGTIYGYAGSTAEKFAKEHNIPFVNIGSDYSIPINNSTSAEATILANEYYTFTGISSLTVTLDTASTTKLDEFMFSFETPSTVDNSFLSIISDDAIKWVKEPNLKSDCIYEVSVVNGVGVIAGTAKEVA